MTTLQERITAAARFMCKQHAICCAVDEHDAWTHYHQDFKDDAAGVLKAAGVEALESAIEEQRLTIGALNMCIGGPGSTSTENITRIGELESQVAALTKAIADCRDAFQIPTPHCPAEQLWANAMADPLAVPDYVKAVVAALTLGAARYQHLKVFCFTEEDKGELGIHYCCDWDNWNDIDASIDAALAQKGTT